MQELVYIKTTSKEIQDLIFDGKQKEAEERSQKEHQCAALTARELYAEFMNLLFDLNPSLPRPKNNERPKKGINKKVLVLLAAIIGMFYFAGSFETRSSSGAKSSKQEFTEWLNPRFKPDLKTPRVPRLSEFPRPKH
jgi:hypothetical protein